MKKIIFYQCNFCQIGGVETFAYNWCWWLRNFFDITILYCSGDIDRLKLMGKLVKLGGNLMKNFTRMFISNRENCSGWTNATKTVFVISADENVIQYAIKKKYGDKRDSRVRGICKQDE